MKQNSDINIYIMHNITWIYYTHTCYFEGKVKSVFGFIPFISFLKKLCSFAALFSCTSTLDSPLGNTKDLVTDINY